MAVIAGDSINDVGRCARELVSNHVRRHGARHVGSGVDTGASVTASWFHSMREAHHS